MSYKLIMSERVLRQLDEIAYYIAEESGDLQTALAVVERLDEAAQKLCYMPYKGSISRDEVICKQGFRVLIVDPYLIFYRCDDEKQEVLIIAVVYSKRDYANLIL